MYIVKEVLKWYIVCHLIVFYLTLESQLTHIINQKKIRLGIVTFHWMLLIIVWLSCKILWSTLQLSTRFFSSISLDGQQSIFLWYFSFDIFLNFYKWFPKTNSRNDWYFHFDCVPRPYQKHLPEKTH